MDSKPMKTVCRVTYIGLFFAMSVAMTPVHAETVQFGTPQWPGATVKTHVASRILEILGYDTGISKGSTAAILKGIEKKDIDVDMAVWRPSQNNLIDPAIEKGTAMELAPNIQDALYMNAVPEYVWDEGVHSLADLNEYADRFDHKFYGIEAGNVGNNLLNKAIKNGTYGFGDWNVVPSSTQGMLAQVQKAVDNEEWVVFLGWQPHWMNIRFDMKYLKDPEGIWGDKTTTVFTVVHPDFLDTSPNVARFLRQMVVPKRVQSRWILQYGLKDRPAEEVAREWIGDHPDKVDGWLEGVTNANGDRSATDMFAAHPDG